MNELLTATNIWPVVLLAVPVVGALLSALLWSTPREPKTWLLLTTLATLLTIGGMTLYTGVLPTNLSLLCLLPVAAFISLLGQPLHLPHRQAWVHSITMLGLCLAAISASGRIQWVFIALTFLALLGLLARVRSAGATTPTWAVGTYGLGAAVAAIAALAPSPVVSSTAGFLACLALIPLFPLHAGHIACLMRLPANLPGFLVVALPAVGFAGLLSLSDLPDLVADLLGPVALLSMVYGSIRALGQRHPLSVLAHGSLAFFSILWWFLAVTETVSPSASVYLIAVGLVTSGLYAGWYAVRIRYGELDVRGLGGLVHPMPRFAVLYSLLALAALGLPPFGVFSGFMGLLLTPEFRLPAAFFCVVLVWLAASWYHLELMRRLLFGPTRPDMRYEDIRETELVSLTMTVVLLVLLGALPARWFDHGTPLRPSAPAVEVTQWHP